LEKKKVAALFISDVLADIPFGTAPSKPECLEKILEEYEPETVVISDNLFNQQHSHQMKTTACQTLVGAQRFYSLMKWVVLNTRQNDNLLTDAGKILGVEVVLEYLLKYGKNTYLFFPRYEFGEKKILLFALKTAYFTAQLFGKESAIKPFAKKMIVSYFVSDDRILEDMAEYAKTKGADTVIFGHTREPMDRIINGIRVVNCGCFTDLPSSFVTIDYDGTLHHHEIS